MPKGVRRDGPRTMCQKGQHPLSEANTLYELDASGKQIRRCLSCRAIQRQERERRRGRKPHPSDTGYCRKGLHAWVEENWLPHDNGGYRCKACAQSNQKKFYAGKHYTACVVGGCERATYRRDESNYVCKAHRAHPPAWFARAGLRVVGTRLLREEGLL